MANFTEKELKSLPNPESGKRKVYHDSKIKGLSVRVTSNGVLDCALCIYVTPKALSCSGPLILDTFQATFSNSAIF